MGLVSVCMCVSVMHGSAAKRGIASLDQYMQGQGHHLRGVGRPMCICMVPPSLHLMCNFKFTAGV